MGIVAADNVVKETRSNGLRCDAGLFSGTDFCLIFAPLKKAMMSQNPPFLNLTDLSHEC
jgi:hypothetical protein